VEAELTREEVYSVVYASRIASRVLRPLASFPCRHTDDLYKGALKLNWDRILKPGQTLKISATVSDSMITHSQYAALKLKDAVVDSLRERTGTRPSVDRDDPDIRLNLHLRHDHATISLYYSEGVMHRRGYRLRTTEAPLKENLAAAAICFAGWSGETPFLDLFCGSGTFLIEAAMSATRTPAGFFRSRQGFESLPDFSQEVWDKVKALWNSKIRSLPKGLLTGVDKSAEALAATRANFAITPYADAIKLVQKDFTRLEGRYPRNTIVANPPYGLRLEDSQDGLRELYSGIGQFLKTKCPDSLACLLIPAGKALEKEIGFNPERRIYIDNGAVEVGMATYKIFEDRRLKTAVVPETSGANLLPDSLG
jgi:putative N6-adenine-specific DNA methylase